MTDETTGVCGYPPVDREGNVINGSVDNYDFDWGDEVVMPERALPPRIGEWPYLCCWDYFDRNPCSDHCTEPVCEPDPCGCDEPDPCGCDRPNPCECNRPELSEEYEIRDL